MAFSKPLRWSKRLTTPVEGDQEDEPAPAWTGIYLVEPPVTEKKRKKASLWPTATQDDAQLKLFG